MRDRLNRWWEKPERGPLKRGHRHPAPLVDVYAPDYIRMWLAFNSKYGFELESVATDSVGLDGPPEWYDRDVMELGWDGVLDLWGAGGDGWSKELGWMVRNGIAPDQPFLVHLDTPHWYRCGGYEYPSEMDCEFYWEILRVAPLRRPSDVLKKWERAVKDEQSDRRFAKKRLAEIECLRRTTVKAMYLKTEVYFAPGQSTYDDMTMPAGIRYVLCSDAALPKEPRCVAFLVSGDDDDGDHGKAMTALVANAMKELPGLSEETIRKLPHRGW